jgi:peptidoglycan/xylan/chitin deacetylase (PgdA/CDA1 family)
MNHREGQERLSHRGDPRARPSRRRRLAAVALSLAIVGTLAAVMDSSGGQRTRVSRQAKALAAKNEFRRAHTSVFASERRVDQRILSYTGYVRAGTQRRPDIALTFDDGPGPFTLRVLAVLKRLHAKATFFEIGRQVRVDPRITARLERAGMAIGNHTQDHPPLAVLTPAAQALELDQAARAIQDTGAPRPLLFRPPYGSFDAATLRLLRARDILMVLWTVDTRDYARPGVRQIVYAAISGAKPGAIILLHDGGGDRTQTLAALPRIIERLHQHGYRLTTVPELLRDDPPPPQPAPQSPSGD